jgi:F-type H+-transporting ATPase subunit b
MSTGLWLKAGGVLLGLGASFLAAGAALAAGGGDGGYSHEQTQDLIWRTVNFIVFAGILIKLVAKPAKQFFGKRSADVAENLADLEGQKNAAAQALAEAEARLAAVEEERQKIIQTYVAEGENEKAKIIDKANQVAVRIKEMAAFTIQAETKKAAQNLKEEVVNMATQMATDLIREKATYADQQGLVEDYLKKVVQAH